MSSPFLPADILLPRDADMNKWACVACDQYTSEPAYWAAADAHVGNAPSALRVVLPELYLNAADVYFFRNPSHNIYPDGNSSVLHRKPYDSRLGYVRIVRIGCRTAPW